ncbi:MAG: phenylalanyl-tRNA synthetase subunit alpha, phenylalanyl-tRNA synthetase alpha chain [Candidatus Parcubacteria bacterium]|jgi:phenylalanyl-tRNA synthetase alpha chain
MLSDTLTGLQESLEKAIKAASSLAELEAAELRFLGRKGELTNILRQLGSLSSDERRTVGAAANVVKVEGERLIAEARASLLSAAAGAVAENEWIDVTEPGMRPPQGHLHITTHAIREIGAIFERIGFTRVRYPEVDWDHYAFEALNMPPEHPARDEWETFFMEAPAGKKGRMILTPHATNGTARILEECADRLKAGEAIRAMNIAKTYRRQSDITHVPMFHQFDGVCVDKGISFAHMHGVFDYFVKAFFGKERTVRLRPFHFRFTEPSVEIDVSCGMCGGTGMLADDQKCRTCKRGWLELGGGGSIHPNVLKMAGIDPKKYSGFAFGWGVERTYMMKEGTKLDDVRTMYKNDVRFLEQF